ncbi:MAG: hypothetical protein J6C01_01520 [Lachnospiraceae bacterium]|nr:hypothetical protein [Lachnospiraceae bacterium]
MGKKIFIGLYVILLLVCGNLVFNFIYNSIVVYAFNHTDYKVTMSPILMFNWSEPYIAHYNQGNLYYKEGYYADAVESYYKALEYKVPQERECSIRINIALALAKSLGDDYADPANVENSLMTLYAARDVLLEKECATDAGDGHSEQAQKLKEEIDAIIKELEEQQQSQQEQDSEQKDEENTKKSEEQKKQEDSFEEDVKKAIQEKKAKANKERQEGLQYYEEMEQDYNFDNDGMIW